MLLGSSEIGRLTRLARLVRMIKLPMLARKSADELRFRLSHRRASARLTATHSRTAAD